MRLPWRRSRTTGPDSTTDDGRGESVGPDEEPILSTGEGILADEPIRTAEDDRLDRSDFARSIAGSIRRAPRGAGFVVAITGPWGDGKTSVLNMITENLKHDHIADVADFNPWLFSGTEQLVERFFAELADQLELASSSERLRRVARLLRGYGKLAGPLRLVPVVGTALAASGQVADATANWLQPDVPSLYKQRGDLERALRTLERPIVIVVDDIDRLQEAEIRDIVRLVRLVGDFPNLIYLLAFERARVESVLGNEDERIGRDYLEKIVQLSQELPPLRLELRDQLFNEAVSEALSDLAELRLDNQIFSRYYSRGARSYFSTLRRIRRFANALPLSAELLGNEVEFADVMMMEIYRLFEPGVFEAIKKHHKVLTYIPPVGLRGDRANELAIREVKEALDKAVNRQEARDCFIDAFPAFERHLDGSRYAPDFKPKWRRERRVAHTEVLDIYVARGLPGGVLATTTVERVVNNLGNQRFMADLLDNIDSDSLERLLSRLEDYEGALNLDSPEVPVEALLNARSKLRTATTGFFDLGADLALDRVVLRLLRSFDQEVVERTVANVELATLSARLALINLVGHESGVGHRLVAEAAAQRFMDDLVERVLSADSTTLRDERDLARLCRTAFIAQPDRTSERLRTLIKDPRFLLRLLQTSLLSSVSGSTGSVAYQVNWPGLVQIVGGVEPLVSAAQALLEASPSDQGDDRARAALEQARRFATDPDGESAKAQRWGLSDPEIESVSEEESA